MSTEAGSCDVSLVQDEDLLRKMWQETEDYGKKKEIRSHMYKIREARLKDFYTTGDESNTSSESRQHSTITTKTSTGNTGLKGADLTTYADNLADHSFLSLKSKEIRDSESPTKDSYKITETKKIDDRDWNVVESNERSNDGKTHTTSRIATTAGKQNVDGGEMNYAAKSEQTASVYKDGDDRNFTKSVGASSQNVIKQEAFGGDDNSKYYSTSTTTSSSSKYTTEQKSTTGDIDFDNYQQLPVNTKSSSMITSSQDSGDNFQKVTTREKIPSSSVRNSQKIVRTVYTEDIPNELKNHPNYIDGNTKVTTETKTLPDGSTVTTTRYETKGATQYSTSSSNTSQSSKHISSKASEHTSKNQVTEDSKRYVQNTRNIDAIDDSRISDTNRDTTIKIIKNQEQLGSKRFVDDSSNQTRIVRSEKEERFSKEDAVQRRQDLALLGRNIENVDVVITRQEMPIQETKTITTTVTKNIDVSQNNLRASDQKSSIKEANTYIQEETIPSQKQVTTTSKSTVTKDINTPYDNQPANTDDFINTERHHFESTQITKKPITVTKSIEPTEKRTETVEIEILRREEPAKYREAPQAISNKEPKATEIIEIEFIPSKTDQPKYEQPERRKPIKPGKSEFDDKLSPTEGQYETTYRTDYVPRRISVEVSPTHDAFARSLRSVSPDRVSKIGSTRSLRTSNTSLRSTSSPERLVKSRTSPASTRPISPGKKTSRSPEKYIDSISKPRYESPAKVSSYNINDQRTPKLVTDTQRTTNTDTITRQKKTTGIKSEVDSSTLTRKKETVEKPRSRSISPTSATSDFEFIRHRSDIVTDLDVDDTKIIKKRPNDLDDRPNNLDLTPTRRPLNITERSITSPLTGKSPTSPTKNESQKQRPKPIRRTDTYEERCREILGISDAKESPRKASLPATPRDRIESPTKPKTFTEISPSKSVPKDKQIVKEAPSQRRRSLEKKPISAQEFPAQIKESPEKQPSNQHPEKPKATKKGPSVTEFLVQIKKSPEREPPQPYPEKPKDSKKGPGVAEFPAQIRKSSQKEPLEPYPEKSKDIRKGPGVTEFPAQIRKSPQKEPLGPYPEKPKDIKKGPGVAEFPAQIRKSPQKEPLGPYPEKSKDIKKGPGVAEFPAQIRKSPQKEPLGPYPEKSKDIKKGPGVAEFPAQIRKSPQKEPLEPYPEKSKDVKKGKNVAEFPALIRKAPQKELSEPYPEKPKDIRRGPGVTEFPAQIRKSPQKELLEPYPEKPKDVNRGSAVAEFPAQIRKSPQKELGESYPGDTTPGSNITQIRKPLEKESIEPYSRKSPEKLISEPYSYTKDFPEIEPIELEFFNKPLEKSANKVSLDDLPLVKTDRVSLDDLPSVGKPQRKISLSDLDQRPDEFVDSFITNEKLDTEITLKQYKDDSSNIRGGSIPELPTSNKPDVKKIKKTTSNDTTKCKKRMTTTITGTDSESSSTEEDEENIEDQIIEDICDVVECKQIKEEKHNVKTVITETQASSKKVENKKPSKPKAKPTKETPVEDFVTVTKAQLLQSSSKLPVEEAVHTKKFMTVLCKDEEEDRATQITMTEQQEKVNEIESTLKSNKTVKKESQDMKLVGKVFDKKKPSDELRSGDNKENLNLGNIKKRTEIKITTKDETKNVKKVDDKTAYETEYTDQFNKKISKVPSKIITTSITLTPTERKVQPNLKKHVEKVEIVRKIHNEPIQKVIHKQIEKKPQPRRFATPDKKSDMKQPLKSKVTAEIKPQSPRITTTTTTTRVQKTTDIQPTRRHVVSTIINIKPKVKPETISKTVHKTTVTKTIIAPKTITKLASKDSKNIKPKKKLIQNGYTSTDEEEIQSEINIKSDIQKVRNQQNVQISTHRKKSPYTKTNDILDNKTTKKCITTKSILIENAVADEREIIVDLRRSKSSREGTPDRICPYPVSSTDDANLGFPRYPDRITEPDDGGSHRPKPKRISDIPISETENVTEFNRIIEVTEEADRIKLENKSTEMESTDECLLSVNEKVNKFLTTAEQVTKKPIDTKPAPKVERPILDVDESLKEDECLLSVSDKVNKFIATAEQLASSTKEIQLAKPSKYIKPDLDDELQIGTTQKKSTERITTEEDAAMEIGRNIYDRRSNSPEKKNETPKRRTPDRSSPDVHTKITIDTNITKTSKKSISPLEEEETPKTRRRLSKDDNKTILSPTGHLRSTETIKKAKALFENIGNDRELARQKDILNRPSVFEGRKIKKTEEELFEKRVKAMDKVRTQLTYDDVNRSPSPDKTQQKDRPSRSESPNKETPHYMSPLDRTIKTHTTREHHEEDLAEISNSRTSRDSSVDRDIPHYMLPLDRSVRERSPHKENLKQLEDIMSRSFGHDEVDVQVTNTTTKFGVTLKRTDSGRMITGHRRTSASSTTDKQPTDEDINVEEIFDLECLEKLLETIVGYDIRRRIRAQIRLIKRSIEEKSYESTVQSRTSSTKDSSPKRSSSDKRTYSEETTHITQMSEYQSSYSSSRKASTEHMERYKSSSPEKYKSSSPSPAGRRSTTPKGKSPSPVRKNSLTESAIKSATTSGTLFQTELKKTKPIAKTVVEEKPDWVKQRTLRKITETSAPIKKSTNATKRETIKHVDREKQTDVITSSYGVGPTDENGSPLFGLKALKAQKKTEKSKVQGTVIRSHYRSENGGEPEGEISITKFSTDPDDMSSKNASRDSKGITSVTTTQKFGYKGTPSLKKITTKDEKIFEGESERKSSITSSKVTRRGSVKEISQKFIENAVDTLKSERQSSYPKAGLILRTSSFKDTASNGTNSREGSPVAQEVHKKTVTTVKKTTTTTSDGKKADTFLSNKSKITGVQDVISRMKNEDVEVEDTVEDAEARNLLNKFLGAQVLLSGMEEHTSKPASTSGNVKRTTKITTTTTSSESSKPNTVTRTFTHPITPELLQTIWDEPTLKLLLEQSTDYEDRRIIRARLREVMAEQEACAELVDKASSEAITMKESQESNTVHGTTTRTFTEGPTTTTSQVTTRITSQQQQVKKPMSPFAKFRQLDKQNSLNSPPSTPKSPIGGGPLFKFTDPALNQSANTVKQRLLQWCQMKTKEYENIQLDNFSTSWADGMAFCALIHHFLPDAFDYKILNPRNRRHNFTLAFRVAEDKADIAPLLDVDDMVAISKPDWKCVFTYVQSIYRRFKDED